MKTFVGIDIGASFIKGAILDVRAKRIHSVQKIPTPSITPKEKVKGCLRYERDADAYVTETKKLLQKLLSTGAPVGGIVFSSQMHGMVLVGKGNVALTPFIGWQDGRMLEPSKTGGKTWMDMYTTTLKRVNLKNTGISLRTGLSGLTLFWMKQSGFLDKHKDGTLLSIGDYVAATLTDGKQYMHPTHACGTALFDVKNNVWDRNILDALDISVRHLPTIAKNGDIVGFFRYKRKAIPVHTCIGDLQAALLGSGITKEAVSINIGTGSQVSYLSSSFRRGDHDVRSFVDGTFLNTVTFIPAGRALNVIIRFIEEIGEKIFGDPKVDIWNGLHKLMRNKTDSKGLKARVSFFAGNATGHDAGLWENVTEKNWTVDNMLYAALENMAENYWQAYRRLTPKGASRVILSGGLIRKTPTLTKLIQKKFGIPVLFARNEEETLRGLLKYGEEIYSHI